MVNNDREKNGKKNNTEDKEIERGVLKMMEKKKNLEDQQQTNKKSKEKSTQHSQG